MNIMNRLLAFFAAVAMALLCGACVSRTVTVRPQIRGSDDSSAYGADQESKPVEKKIIWIWQDEYRNTK